MNYNFFAVGADRIEVLKFIFNETDLQLFDLYSSPGQEVSNYQSLADLAAKFDVEKEGSHRMAFVAWSPRFKVAPHTRKVELNPRYCDGHTFRYSTEGWGLIQLYFGELKVTSFGGVKQKRLSKSHIGHHNLKGALEWGDPGEVNQWAWKEIEKTSRKLKSHVHYQLAVKKAGPNGVLKGAEILERHGVVFSN